MTLPELPHILQGSVLICRGKKPKHIFVECFTCHWFKIFVSSLLCNLLDFGLPLPAGCATVAFDRPQQTLEVCHFLLKAHLPLESGSLHHAASNSNRSTMWKMSFFIYLIFFIASQFALNLCLPKREIRIHCFLTYIEIHKSEMWLLKPWKGFPF